MSTTEIDRLGVVQRVFERRVMATDAAAQLSISRRQMTRLVATFKADGPPGRRT